MPRISGGAAVRERVFLIGSREGQPFDFPSPTHSGSDERDLFGPSSLTAPHGTRWAT